MPGNNLGPPEREEPGPTPETGPNHKLVDTTTNGPQPTAQPRQCGFDTVAGLHRRRRESWRLPVLESGRSEPWYYAPQAAGYEEAAHHLLGHGLLPAPNREGLRLMWGRGGHHRRAAELIAERWELGG